VRATLMMVFVAAGFAGALSLAAQPDDPAEFPKDFRTFAHVKTVLIGPQSPYAATDGGFHHIYANPQAVEGYVSGQFADGSAIVYELLEANEKDGVVSEGAPRRVDMMIKDSARFKATGGWGFERFKASGEITELGSAQKTCFDCHARALDHGFVFSRMR